jgi:hypothetical protein
MGTYPLDDLLNGEPGDVCEHWGVDNGRNEYYKWKFSHCKNTCWPKRYNIPSLHLDFGIVTPLLLIQLTSSET